MEYSDLENTGTTEMEKPSHQIKTVDFGKLVKIKFQAVLISIQK